MVQSMEEAIVNEVFKSIELERAKLAYEFVKKIYDAKSLIKDLERKVTSYTHRLSAAIPADGIMHVLVFTVSKAKVSGIRNVAEWVESRGKLESLGADDAAHAFIYYYVARHLCKCLGVDVDLREKPLKLLEQLAGDYDLARRASREALAFLIWVKRFMEAEFGVVE